MREHASAVECDLGRPLAQSTSHVQNPLQLVDDTPQLHDASGTITTMRAWNPKGSGNGIQYQDTKSLYESPFDGSFATSTIYPDSSDTTSSGTDQVKTAYSVACGGGYDPVTKEETNARECLRKNGIMIRDRVHQ